MTDTKKIVRVSQQADGRFTVDVFAMDTPSRGGIVNLTDTVHRYQDLVLEQVSVIISEVFPPIAVP